MQFPRLLTLAILVSALFICVVHADDAAVPGPDQPGFALTIYSTADPGTFDPQDYLRMLAANPYYLQQNPLPGFGIIRENREIDLAQGDNTVRFTDVAAAIDPTTVSFHSLDGPGDAAVLEQNYEFDLVSADKLLDKYLDKEIQIAHHSGAGSAPAETITGTLLSFDASNIVLQNDDGKVLVLSRGAGIDSIELAKPQAGLITKPTLV